MTQGIEKISCKYTSPFLPEKNVKTREEKEKDISFETILATQPSLKSPEVLGRAHSIMDAQPSRVKNDGGQNNAGSKHSSLKQRELAEELETQFVSSLLQPSFKENFSSEEAQPWVSFLTQAVAGKIVEQGGIGIAKHINDYKRI